MNFFKKHLEKNCKRRDRKGTEAALLIAASKLFALKGYENTRTLEIAKEAGVNEALIGRYFGGKEGLLTAVLLDSSHSESVLCGDENAIQKDAISPCENGCSLMEGLKRFFKTGKEAMKEKESFIRISHSRAFIDEKMSEMVRAKIIEQRLPVMEANLRTYFKNSKLKKDEVTALAMIIASNNFTLNFMGRIIYKMEDEKVDLAISVLAKALNEYIEKRSEA